MLPIESPTLTHAIARSNRSGSQAGFTRPDLVATSALIAALLMLGVRTHSDAAQNARWALCQDHQSALLKSWHAYSDDRKGSLPGNTDDGNTLGSNWVGGTVTDPLIASDASVLTNRSRAALGGYVSDPAVFRCPADTSTVQARGARTPRNRSYAMNCAVGTSSDGVRPTDGAWLDNAHGHTANSVWRTFGRMSDIVDPSPSKLFVLIDEDETSLNDGSFGMGMKSSEWIDFPATRHSQGASVGFADGSVMMKRWTDPRTIVQGIALTRRLVPGSPDVRWLQDRTTTLVPR